MTFSYVPSYLHWMLFEVIKNSLKAVHDKYEYSTEAQPTVRWYLKSNLCNGYNNTCNSNKVAVNLVVMTIVISCTWSIDGNTSTDDGTKDSNYYRYTWNNDNNISGNDGINDFSCNSWYKL